MKFEKKEYVRKQLMKSISIAVSISSFVGVFIALIPSGNICWQIKMCIIVSSFFVAFVVRSFFLLLKRKRRLFSVRGVEINIMYGDLLKIKGKDKDRKPVVVIPVNSSFDCIVEDNLNIPNPIVSKETLHGKWIIKITGGDKKKINQLKKDIDNGIRVSGLVAEKTLKNKRGNNKVYKLGSAILIDRDDCGYLLFALSEFDENNHVIEQRRGLFPELMDDLVAAISRCQARDVFIPVMGVGLSLFGLDHKQAYGYLKASIYKRLDTLKSSVTIVIFSGDRDKISIYD